MNDETGVNTAVLSVVLHHIVMECGGMSRGFTRRAKSDILSVDTGRRELWRYGMKKARNELLQFLAGLAMLIAGLFIFSQKVMVSSGFFGSGLRLGGFHMGNGLIMVPFIIGVVWMFASEGSIASKLFTAAGVFIVVVAIIMTTHISLVRVTLYEWVVILVLIFGGAGLLARILFRARPTSDDRRQEDSNPQIEETKARVNAIEDELERMKREKR